MVGLKAEVLKHQESCPFFKVKDLLINMQLREKEKDQTIEKLIRDLEAKEQHLAELLHLK